MELQPVETSQTEGKNTHFVMFDKADARNLQHIFSFLQRDE